MKAKQNFQIKDMHPADIRHRMDLAGVSQVYIAKSLLDPPVSQQMVSRIIKGLDVSDRIRRAIADAIDTDIKLIWPSTYLYSEPRKPGRPFKSKQKKDN